MDWLDAVKWNADGLVPVIAQERGSGDVLMFAWMNRDALAETAASGRAVYWSRSRAKLWRKGEESGHTQQVHAIRMDCDSDVLLLDVTQRDGIACHTGRHSCFFHALRGSAWVVDQQRTAAPPPSAPPRKDGAQSEEEARIGDDTLARLSAVIASRRGGDPDASYVARLFARGGDAILKKIGEEATEVVMAAKDGDRVRIVAEMADLWFHGLVALAHHGIEPGEVLAELRRREGQSGLDEHALRKVREREGGSP